MAKRRINRERAHCQRACCANIGHVNFIEWEGYQRDKSRGVEAGYRWYCDDCTNEMVKQMNAAPNVTLIDETSIH